MRSFTTGVPRTHDEDVIFFGILPHNLAEEKRAKCPL
jgi:hypothetical protein